MQFLVIEHFVLEKYPFFLSQKLTFEAKIKELESSLTNEKQFTEKLGASGDRQDGIIDELNENLVRHVETIKYLEQKLYPQVNNVHVRGGSRGRGNPRHKQPRRGKRCADTPCQNFVERCERCGKWTDNNYCNICKIQAINCTECMYNNSVE